MPELDIPYMRLHNQRLAGEACENSAEVVRGLVAVQSQDFAGAKWALAQRVRGATDADIQQLFNAGAILRTHIMRPTWHFITPADIRWLLALTAPRVHAANAYYYRQLKLDQAVFNRTKMLMEKALQGGRQLTRPELAVALQQGGIDVSNRQRLTYILMHAELEGLLCSGALQGKQHTYALLEERAPSVSVLDSEEAMVELTRRYFITRGPATAQDFAWWSGLTVGEATRGLEMIKTQVVQETINGRTYWSFPAQSPGKDTETMVYLLPNFDEYISSYKDRSDVVHPRYQVKIEGLERLPFSHMIFLHGLLVGSWQRVFKNGAALINAEHLTPLSIAAKRDFTAALQGYSEFLGMPVVLETG